MTDFQTQLLLHLNTIANALTALKGLPIPLGSAPITELCKFTFGEWLLQWQDKYKKHKQNDKSFKWNLQQIKDKIIPVLGNIKLVDLTTDHIQDFYNTIPQSNSRDKLAMIFSGSLRKAFDLGHISRNPYNAVEKVKNQAESYAVLQPYAQARVFRFATDKRYLDMFWFFCCTGFRLSEGFSIDPRTDINFNRNVINLTMADNKNKKHKRTVPFLPKLFKDFDLTAPSLFPNITPNGAYQYFSKLFKRENIDGCLHSFRHTFISCCNHVKIPAKHVQEWVGHTDIAMTMNIYTHILEGKDTPIILYLKQLKNTLNI